jgi:hypothetical protein
MISVPAETPIWFAIVAGQSSKQFCGRIENMLIDTVLFIAFVVTTGAAIVKAYEWIEDVLYGPHLERSEP